VPMLEQHEQGPKTFGVRATGCPSWISRSDAAWTRKGPNA
jgi:hypothetical protein